MKTDLLLESLLLLLHQKPQCVFLLPVVPARQSPLSARSRRVVLMSAPCPTTEDLLEYLKGQHKAGRTLRWRRPRTPNTPGKSLII